jgi:ketosteroid isomerase-like protein
MSVKDQALAVIDALNRHDFAHLITRFDEEAILDLPDGIRVIGQASFRDTLSAYVLRHDLTLTDTVVMMDEAGFRVAVECTLNGQNRRTVDTDADGEAGPYALPAVLVLERDGDLFSRFSLFCAVRP